MQSKLTKQFIHNIVFIFMLNALAWTQHFEPVWFGEGDGQTINPIARDCLRISKIIYFDFGFKKNLQLRYFLLHTISKLIDKLLSHKSL